MLIYSTFHGPSHQQVMEISEVVNVFQYVVTMEWSCFIFYFYDDSFRIYDVACIQFCSFIDRLFSSRKCCLHIKMILFK